jgi:hypothetical protein
MPSDPAKVEPSPREEALSIVREWVHMDARSLLASTDKRVLVNALYALLDGAHTPEHGYEEALAILRGGR